MKHFIKYRLIATFTGMLFFSCADNNKSDAYGNFEAITVTVSAEGVGKLMAFSVKEGKKLEVGEMVGLIDTTQLHLEKRSLQARLAALDDKLQDASPEIAILLEEKQNALRERNRTAALYAQKAATKKQLDDLNGQIDLLDQQINSTKRRIGVTNRGILSERQPLEAQIEIVDQHITDNQIKNPIPGTVLTKITEQSEFVNTGTALYKIADLSTLKLRAFTSANLLQKVQLNNEVTVLVDDGKEGYKRLPGIITWIAGKAEFTPKTIETKEERVNLVYAIDVDVQNDGSLKIGMPGEVVFESLTE